MGLPIVQEIFDFIRWLIDFFVNKVPKPIKFLIFMLFIVFIGSMISWTLHFGGFHCNTNKDLVKVDTLNVVDNMKIWYHSYGGQLTGATATIDQAHPTTKYIYFDSAIDSCTLYMKNVSGEFEMCDANESDCYFYYLDAECYDCTSVSTGLIYAPDTLLNWISRGDVCYGNATALEEPRNFLYRNFFCEPLCEIPQNYVWDWENGYFVCQNDSICGDNATPTNYQLDFDLTQAGAELYYDNVPEKDVRRLIGLQCNNDLHPRMTFFGIDLFNFKFWLFATVIYLLIILFHKLRVG